MFTVHALQMKYLRNIKRSIRNHPLIHATIIKIVMKVTVRNQIRASYVDQRIILLQIFQNRTLGIKKFTGTSKSLKLVRTDHKMSEKLQMELSHRRYMRLWHVCLPMKKYLEEIFEIACNVPIGF